MFELLPVSDPAFLGVLVLVGVGVVFVWWVARRQTDVRVAPRLGGGGSLAAQLFAQVGTDAAVRDTIGLRRIRASLGVRLVSLWLVGMIGWSVLLMYGPDVLLNPGTEGWPMLEVAAIGASLWSAFYFWTWTASYDPEELTVEAYGLRLARQPWRKLVAVTERSAWFFRFHFADGTSVRVPKHVVGRAHLLQTADHWIREAHPNAGTARG